MSFLFLTVQPTRGSMKLVLSDAPADLLTRYPREAGADLLISDFLST